MVRGIDLDVLYLVVITPKSNETLPYNWLSMPKQHFICVHVNGAAVKLHNITVNRQYAHCFNPNAVKFAAAASAQHIIKAIF